MKSLKEEIKHKLEMISRGDINLDGNSEDYIEGFKDGLEWVIEQTE